jgi:hypothetical protein
MFNWINNYFSVEEKEQEIQADQKQISFRNSLLCLIKKYRDRTHELLKSKDEDKEEVEEFTEFRGINDIKYYALSPFSVYKTHLVKLQHRTDYPELYK